MAKHRFLIYVFFTFISLQLTNAGQVAVNKNLHSIENGEKNHHNDHIRNEHVNSITLQHHNESNNNQIVQEKHKNNHINSTTTTAAVNNERNSNQSTEHNPPAAAAQTQPYNLNIEYTNESIRNNSNGINNNTCENSNGDRAIIDVINTTHTSNDLKVTTTTSTTTHTNAITAQLPNKNDENTETANDEQSNRKKQKLSNKIVVLLRRSKPIALVVINSILAVSIVISVCTTMGWDYTVPAIVFGVAAIVASSGLWYWLYIAAVTAPRDIRYVYHNLLVFLVNFRLVAFSMITIFVNTGSLPLRFFFSPIS